MAHERHDRDTRISNNPNRNRARVKRNSNQTKETVRTLLNRLRLATWLAVIGVASPALTFIVETWLAHYQPELLSVWFSQPSLVFPTMWVMFPTAVGYAAMTLATILLVTINHKRRREL